MDTSQNKEGSNKQTAGEAGDYTADSPRRFFVGQAHYSERRLLSISHYAAS